MVYATDEGNIHLDHALNISVPSISPSIERSLTSALKSVERACESISHSITIFGYAAAAYLVMAGLSRLIEARSKRLPPPPPKEDGNDIKGSGRNETNCGKAKGDDVTMDMSEEWAGTAEWEREIAANPGLLDGIP